MLRGFNDPSPIIRQEALDAIKMEEEDIAGGPLKEKVINLALYDSNSTVRAMAIDEMGTWGDTAVNKIIENGLLDSSYLVITTALQAMAGIDSARAYEVAQVLEKDSADAVISGLCAVYARVAGPEKNDFFIGQIDGEDVSYNTVVSYGQYLSRWAEDEEVLQKALPVLYDIGANDPKWYVRLAATNSLENVYSALDAQKDVYIATLLQEEVSSDEKQLLYNKVNMINIRLEELEKKVGAIKAAETNANLKMMYGTN
jgi:hypothetical protein